MRSWLLAASVLAALISVGLRCRVGMVLRLSAFAGLLGSAAWALAVDPTTAGLFLLFPLIAILMMAIGGTLVMKPLDRWFDEKRRSGWTTPDDARLIADQGWHWFDALFHRRCVKIDRLAINPRGDTVEAAFTLTRPWFPPTLRTRRRLPRFLVGSLAGGGVIARTGRPVVPPVIALPQAFALTRMYRLYFPFEGLAPVEVTDPRLSDRWALFSPDPAGAAVAITRDEDLRNALTRISEEQLGRVDLPPGKRITFGRRPRYTMLLIELRDGRAAVLGGPKFLGRDLLDDLEGTARLIRGGGA